MTPLPTPYPDFLPGLPDDVIDPPPAPVDHEPGQPLHEIAPGLFASGLPEWEMPSHCVCRLVPGPHPGTWVMEPIHNPGWIRMCGDIGEKLGMRGLAHMSVRRLIQGGYIDHIRLHPNGIFISLESLLNHLRATRMDCTREQSFWTPERIARWRETLGSHSNLEG